MNNTTFVCLVFRRLPFSFSCLSAFMCGVPDPFLCISILGIFLVSHGYFSQPVLFLVTIYTL